MNIRAITTEDIPALLAMSQKEEGFKPHEDRGFWTEQQLKSWIEAGEDVLLAVEIRERVVGFVLTTLHRPTGKVTWENQFILPAYRRQKLARALTEEMLRQLEAKGAVYIHFLVKSDNPESIDYYRKHGFEQGTDCAWFGKFL